MRALILDDETGAVVELGNEVHLQIELIKRHRAGRPTRAFFEGIQLSINAIATALRNSG